MKKTSYKRVNSLLGASVAITAFMIATGPALAQEADEEKSQQSNDNERKGSAFGEIVVTATKREQQIQDVPISITAFDGDQIAALGYTSAQQVTSLAPGVSTVQPNGESNYSLAIRGAANSDFTTNVESPVALYVDEVYISQSSGSGFSLFDTERVEILRGPQGTLFGRNATGGLAHYISVKPGFEPGGYLNVGFGSFNTVTAEGAANLPISDTLTSRVSVSTTQGDGYVTNRLRPNRNLNNSNDVAGRFQLYWEPSDTFNALLNLRYGSEDIRTGFFEFVSAPIANGTPQPTSPNPALTGPDFPDGFVDLDGDVFAGEFDFEGFNDLETFGTTLTLKANLGFAELTSITDFQTVNRNYIEDSDASPVNFFNFFLTTDAEQYSQELRLAGEAGSINWVAGLYFLNIDINDSNGGIAPGFIDDFGELLGAGPLATLGVANGINAPYTQTTTSYSGFGQIDWDINDKLQFTLGGRYIVDEKDFAYQNQLVLFADTAADGLAPNIFIDNNVAPFAATRTDNLWSARVQLNYKPTDNLLAYIGYNRGVRGGGFNAPLLPTAELATPEFLAYDPEVLNSYETGFKWTLPNGIGRFNVSAYYYDYNNYQAFSIIGLDTFTLNADAENYGFEAELFLNPTDGLDLLFGVGYINATVNNVAGVTDPIVTPIGTIDAILPPGQSATPVQTPTWNLSGLIRYEAPIDALGGAVIFQADGQYRSEHFFSLTQLPASRENGYAIFNGSVAYKPNAQDWELRVGVENIFDEEYLVQTFDLSGTLLPAGEGLFGLIEQYFGRPRTWRASVKINF